MPTTELRKSFIKVCNQINQDMMNTLIDKEGIYNHFARSMHTFIHEKLEQLSNKWSKKDRQRITQSWSYNEMIKKIAELIDDKKIECLNRNFTQSSHLIHADETALGVINDRKNRGIKEKEALSVLHEVRLLRDAVNLYSAPLKVLHDIYEVQTNNITHDALLKFDEVSSSFKHLQDLIK